MVIRNSLAQPDSGRLSTEALNSTLAHAFADEMTPASAVDELRSRLLSDLAAARCLEQTYGLSGHDPKNPRKNRKVQRIRARHSPDTLDVATRELDRLYEALSVMDKRVHILKAADRVKTVRDGIALCEDLSSEGNVRIYAPGRGTDAVDRAAMVFRDDDDSGRWTGILKYRVTVPRAKRGTAPGTVGFSTYGEAMEAGRNWVATGVGPNGVPNRPK